MQKKKLNKPADCEYHSGCCCRNLPLLYLGKTKSFCRVLALLLLFIVISHLVSTREDEAAHLRPTTTSKVLAK